MYFSFFQTEECEWNFYRDNFGLWFFVVFFDKMVCHVFLFLGEVFTTVHNLGGFNIRTEKSRQNRFVCEKRSGVMV